MKLTKEEQRWLGELEALLAACPSKRLGFYTIGDRAITVYDFTKERKIADFMDASGFPILSTPFPDSSLRRGRLA